MVVGRGDSEELARGEIGQVQGQGGGRGSEDLERWEKCKGSEVARLERWENGEVKRWEVPSFIQEEGRHRLSPKFHLFVSDVDQQWNKGAGQAQDYLALPEEWENSPYI